MTRWIIIIAVLCIIASSLIVIYDRLRTRQIMDRLSKMLDQAIGGDFSESTFNESKMSALETKLVRYLSGSQLSVKNIAEEKDKIKQLISDISHQTKTPISNLLLYSELLQEQMLSQEAKSNVEALHGQAQKLRFLIDSLVKLSRLETGILALHPKAGSLQPMLREVYEQFQAKAVEKGLDLTLETTEVCAVFDGKWTGEALCNMVDNAIKYTSEGSVTICVKAYELFACIEVADSGSGIAEDEQAKVFSRFYRSPGTEDGEGVGIGLYLAREIISGQGGYIKLTSDAGKGSVFAVFLPREAHGN